MIHIQQQDDDVHAWWGSRVECTSMIARLLREGRLNAMSAQQTRAALQQLWSTIQEVAPTEDVRARAERCLAVHPLRAADALQIGAALIWARERPQGVEFVSLDTRLREAAAREGFTVLPSAV
jgi:hypothetical protein